ncbi:MAG: AMP-binding protein [Pseudomonadota bacterium]
MIPPDGDALALRQTERRRAAVMRAKESRYYAGKLDHIDPDAAHRPEVWSQIPVLDKEMLRGLSSEAFYRDFCLAHRDGIAEYWRSGGSTGRPLFYPRTRADVEFALIGFKRVLACAGFTEADVAHLSLPLGIHPAGHLMGGAAADEAMGVVWAGGGNTAPSQMQLEMMRIFRPTAWIGMASYGLQLANLARAEGFDLAGNGFEKILTTAEPLSASKRQKLAELFGASVRDSYGMTEVMMLGAEDATCDGFRFCSDFCFPEVVDETTLEPVGEGEPGLLLVTALVTNNATPFLRWNTGDVVTMRRGGVGGGPYDVFPLIKHTHRTAGFVKVRGVNIGFTDFEDLMFRTPEVADFKVEITFDGSRDELGLALELADGAQTEKVASEVRRVFEVMPAITVLPAGAIAKSFEGAFKPARFVDRRS